MSENTERGPYILFKYKKSFFRVRERITSTANGPEDRKQYPTVGRFVQPLMAQVPIPWSWLVPTYNVAVTCAASSMLVVKYVRPKTMGALCAVRTYPYTFGRMFFARAAYTYTRCGYSSRVECLIDVRGQR